MKILKIFGLVVGIHVFALILIFANPGCSATTKPAPVPADTAPVPPPAAPSVAVAAPPPAFNPDAPALPAPDAGAAGGATTVRFVPTRPGTPVATTLTVEPVADVQPATTYAVRPGDSLWTIAKKHQLTVAQLTAANALPANAVLKIGQKLVIPGQSPAPAVAAETSAKAPDKAARTTEAVPAKPAGGGAAVKHVVKSGETLGGIARTYGVKTGELAAVNAITDPAKIYAGMELTIPGWDSPAGKAGKAGTAKSGNGKAAAGAAKSAPAPAAPMPPPTISFDAPPASTPPVPVIRLDGDPVPAPTKAP